MYWNSKASSVRDGPALLSWTSACMNQEDWGANSAKGSDKITLGPPQNLFMFLNVPGSMENAILCVQVECCCV